ncbi:hypothetical protein DFH06DRAFT_1314613 [Mycena polygramma]|nr:hypothetical protein DFH06DRAFT_1314606 [Mycena polygramma]KAJ7682395.1 hypothetical protein DFH06DRAFT_1314613 [Mycena polygramma]
MNYIARFIAVLFEITRFSRRYTLKPDLDLLQFVLATHLAITASLPQILQLKSGKTNVFKSGATSATYVYHRSDTDNGRASAAISRLCRSPRSALSRFRHATSTAIRARAPVAVAFDLRGPLERIYPRHPCNRDTGPRARAHLASPDPYYTPPQWQGAALAHINSARTARADPWRRLRAPHLTEPARSWPRHAAVLAQIDSVQLNVRETSVQGRQGRARAS